MKNYQLYARILRLFTDFELECQLRAVQSGQACDGMHEIVRTVIFPDRTLIWC